MEIITIENLNGSTTEHVIIETETGFISMPKSVYDEQQAALKANETISK